MRIDVSGKHFEITDPIHAHALNKAERLPKYFDGLQSVEIVIEPAPHDHFSVEFRADAEKHDTFVASDEGDDLYSTIDSVYEKMSRQLRDFKDKLKDKKR